MRRSRFSDDEIIALVAEADSGVPIDAICRSAAISLRTFYRWRRACGGVTAPAVRRLKSLEEENRKLRRSLGLIPADRRAPSPARPAGGQPVRAGSFARIDGKLQPWPPAAAKGRIASRHAAFHTGRPTR